MYRKLWHDLLSEIRRAQEVTDPHINDTTQAIYGTLGMIWKDMQRYEKRAIRSNARGKRKSGKRKA